MVCAEGPIIEILGQVAPLRENKIRRFVAWDSRALAWREPPFLRSNRGGRRGARGLGGA